MPQKTTFAQKVMGLLTPRPSQNDSRPSSNAGNNSWKARNFPRGLNCSKCNEPLNQSPTLCPACGTYMA
ncbi:hypothetical protein BDN71DRAFT_1447857 [Pleurotus eryngii]|uniref:Zinc-ribbon domain-containing protein n=1 Tax=Pleurotus eryngii TaxID=5323 RepID=A0A9P5ZVT8_PLEER|nr:hypothetical protein BDN71DRAFT_1447857 [Pleurotus eryngii]